MEERVWLKINRTKEIEKLTGEGMLWLGPAWAVKKKGRFKWPRHEKGGEPTRNNDD
jgi:hypothetical protein